MEFEENGFADEGAEIKLARPRPPSPPSKGASFKKHNTLAEEKKSHLFTPHYTTAALEQS